MAGSHKKKLRAEKAKVKLKGAKLPKGLNVTKTEFKVRKILIREQLSAQYTDGQRVINLKETLSKLKHHSSGPRNEALRNLKHSIAAGDTKIISHLNELTQGIGAIALDVERDTRRECFAVLSLLLGTLGVDAMTPFFHILSSYLRCAMTHIQPSIQEDSLLMLDVLLQHVPKLVAGDSDKIFPNFLEMISKVRAEGDKAGRLLTVNMGNKQTSIKWRSRVLQRLQRMLYAMLEQKLEPELANNSSNKQHARLAAVTHMLKPKEANYFPLLRAVEVADLTHLFTRSSGDASDTALAEERQKLEHYARHLMPLLLESWLEVRPQTKTSSGGQQSLLDEDAAYTLKVVLDVINTLWLLVQHYDESERNAELADWLRATYKQAFATNFMQHGFPYQQKEVIASKQRKAHEPAQKDVQKKKQRGAGGAAADAFCLQQNILLAQLMCNFYGKNIQQQQLPIFQHILQYLTNLVSTLKRHSTGTALAENLLGLDKTLRCLLLSYGSELLQFATENMRQLLSETIKAFLELQFPQKEGLPGRILVLLCDIVQQPQLRQAFGEERFHAFLAYLPKVLLRPSISIQALESMSCLGKQKNRVFLSALAEAVEAVIDNLQKLQINGAIHVLEAKKLLMNLFYWLEISWNAETEQRLLQKVEENVKDKNVANYFKWIISSRSVKVKEIC